MLNGPRYDVERIQFDMTVKGWLPVDLARRAGVSASSVGRFLSGEFQTPRMAKRLSKALGRGPGYYLMDESAPVVEQAPVAAIVENGHGNRAAIVRKADRRKRSVPVAVNRRTSERRA